MPRHVIRFGGSDAEIDAIAPVLTRESFEARRDDRQPGRHRFQQHVSKTFAARQENKEI
jgi:hypothetical protein